MFAFKPKEEAATPAAPSEYPEEGGVS